MPPPSSVMLLREGGGRKGFVYPADGAISRVKMFDKRRPSLIRSFKALHCPFRDGQI